MLVLSRAERAAMNRMRSDINLAGPFVGDLRSVANQQTYSTMTDVRPLERNSEN